MCGRINRAKFWLAMLLFFLVDIVLAALGLVLGGYMVFEILSAAVNLALFIAGAAASLAAGIARASQAIDDGSATRTLERLAAASAAAEVAAEA